MLGDNEIVIGNKGSDYVSFTISQRWSDGGFSANIEVQCDGWTGRISGVFHTGELNRFAQEIYHLYRDLLGTARLDPLEPNVSLTLAGDGKGHVAVQGIARNHFENETELRFKFTIDQTYLKGIADSLVEADPE